MHPSAATLLRASRPLFRHGATRATPFFTAQTSRATFRQAGRRFQSTAAPGAAQESWVKKMWDSPVGLKTVHFWYALSLSPERLDFSVVL